MCRTGLIITLLLSCVFSMKAQTAAMDSAKTDAINTEALNPNFIKTSLLVISPGSAVYSAYGHSAIRMQCPSKHLDYCFTFEMDMHTSSYIDFIFHNAKAGFAAASTKVFLQQYRNEGRGVNEYYINLSPREKQELWRNLDIEVANGAYWNYDYPNINCTSMCIYVIEKSLSGERIKYTKINPALNGTYRELLHYISRNSPWMRLFWNIMLIGKGGQTEEINDKMTPKLLAESWQKANLVDSVGSKRPMLKGKYHTLLPNIRNDQPCWFSPIMALILLLVATSTILWITRKRKKTSQNNKIIINVKRKD